MAYTQLTETERYQISSLREAGFSQLFIAESLKRSPSTISRELKRNQEVQTYCTEQAHLKGLARRHFAKKAVACMRHISANMLRAEPTKKASIRRKRLFASMDINYLDKVLVAGFKALGKK